MCNFIEISNSIFFLHFLHKGKYDELPSVIVGLAMVSKSCIAGGWAAVQVFSAETFPTVVR